MNGLSREQLLGDWIRERRRDFYYRRAKEEGYRSRAAYKLLQANDKLRFIRRGDVVLDLGAAPGGWMQVLRGLVGEKGFVVGIDLTPLKGFPWDNVISVVADFRHVDASTLLSRFPRAVDVVVSDASPNVSGIWELDHARQIELAESAFDLSRGLLRRGGNFFAKVFQGDLLNAFRGKVGHHFENVKLLKPKACRKESAEMYLLATGYGLTKRV